MKRRTFLIGSVAVAGGFAIGYRAVQVSTRELAAFDLSAGQTLLNPYIMVDANGITIMTPRAEMGQGIHTTLAALVAEELDISLTDVRVEHGPATELYRNTIMFPENPDSLRSRLRPFVDIFRSGDYWQPSTLTGGQRSIQEGYVKMRKAGAAARAVLVAAAAEELNELAENLRTVNGEVISPQGARISYVDLATRAADIAPPADPKLKARDEWKLLGNSLPRVDMRPKCTGAARYSVDTRLPEILFATVRRNPNIGGNMISFDASRASKLTGVRKIISLDDGVIVVATNSWYALRAADAVDIEWGPAAYPESTTEHYATLKDALANDINIARPRDDGDVESVLARSRVISGEYQAPYLAHATMEPMNAVAWLRDGKLDIWAGSQWPTKAVVAGAELAGVGRDAVRVHTTYMGGGFGRRLEMDFVDIAVRAARAMQGTPVLVTWSREEDMTHDVYRPAAVAVFRACIADGLPKALDIKVSSAPLFASEAAREGRSASHKVDQFAAAGLRKQPYSIENYRVTAHPAPASEFLPVGWWRSVGESQNSFFHECIIDELAYAADTDPLKMRLDLLNHAPSRQVLESVAEMSDWGSKLPEGHARGVAYVLSSGAPTAQVIEIRVNGGAIEIVKAYVVADVGIALDPRNIESQLQSALIYGLTAAISGQITVKGGKVEQTNFDSYKIMRMHEIPEIEIKIFESGEKIFGVGEAATPAAAPALGNAIFAATGKRIRELPFNKSIRFS